MPRAQRAPSLASTVGRVCSRRRQTRARGPRLKQPGGPRPEGPDSEHLLVFAFLRENQASAGVSRPRPRPPRPPGPPSVRLPTPAPRCPASTGKAALGAGFLEPPSCSWPTTWALPGGPCLSQKEGGNKKQTLGRGVCETLTLQACEGRGCGAWPRRDLPTAPREPVRAHVCACTCARVHHVAFVPTTCTHGARVCVCWCTCARVCICVSAACADGLTELLEPI